MSRFVETTIQIAVPPAKVMEAFTHPEMLRDWWGVERCLIEPKKGGSYTLGWHISEHGIKYVSSGVFKTFDPERGFVVGSYIYLNPDRPFLGGQVLKVSIEKTEKGSHVTVRQGPYPENAGADWEWYYQAVKSAWPLVVDTLAAYLESNQ
ncbi:MAG: SRPBCC domain-containing protein [Saprospiraceae bacterium]|nr:SRPBCC domain-containing protein [Saprospiraceae bacterium]